MPAYILKNPRKVRMENIFKKILIIQAGGIGDLIMLTPAISAVKKNFPQAQMDVFVGPTPAAKEVLEGSAIISNVFSFDFLKASFFKKIKFIVGLRKEKYDLAIVASGTNPFRGSVLALLVGAKIRVGEYRSSKMNFYNRKTKLDGNMHKIVANLKLLESLGIRAGDPAPAPFFAVRDEDRKFVDEFIVKNNLQGKVLVGFFPVVGSRQQFKSWPVESFIELGRMVLENFPGSAIIILGSPTENDLCLKIRDGIGNNSAFVANYSLKKAAALIDRCKVCVSADGGLGHVASTTKTELIAIFGPTIQKRTGPIGERIHVIEAKCSYQYHDIFTPKYDTTKEHRCLKSITPAVVFNKVKEIFYENAH